MSKYHKLEHDCNGADSDGEALQDLKASSFKAVVQCPVKGI